MADSAVLTTAMSSMSIAVAAHTTVRVQRWVRGHDPLRAMRPTRVIRWWLAASSRNVAVAAAAGVRVAAGAVPDA